MILEGADCLYSLGVLAYNNQELSAAMEYVDQLRERFPDYENTETLAQYCAYSLGNQAVTEAGQAETGEEQMACYSRAIEWFQAAGDYEDSRDRGTECRYRIAVILRDLGRTEQAVALFAALEGYKDAGQLRMDCMFDYVQLHWLEEDPQARAWLAELVEADYAGAQALQDRLEGKGFAFRLTLGPGDYEATLVEAGDLSQVYIHYDVTPRDGDGAALVLVLYSLPDGREGRALLNMDGSAKGSRGWKNIPFPDKCDVKGEVTLKFYDSMLGEKAEPLETLRFRYTAADRTEEASSGSGQTGRRSTP